MVFMTRTGPNPITPKEPAIGHAVGPIRPTTPSPGDHFEHIYEEPITMYRCPGAHHWTQPKSAQNRAVYISQGAMTQWRNICRTHAELTQSGYESYGAYRTYRHAHIHQSMHLQAQIRPATAGTSNSTHHSASCANATLEGSALQEMAVSLRRLASARRGEAITVA